MSGQGVEKDMVAVITGKMIVELSELATMRRADVESLKALLTKCVDDVRLSYERDAKSYPRTCVFLGTTNKIKESYIADETGARRFWPCVVGEVKAVNVDLLTRDVDQLWAEAIEAYEDGEDWHTVPRELVLQEQADRQITVIDNDPWYGKIKSALTDPDSYAEVFFIRDEYVKGVQTGEFVVRMGKVSAVLGIVLGVDISKQGAADSNRIVKIMLAMGFKKVRPAKKWFDNTYAYDLSRDSHPHLWSSIKAAQQSVKFPKHEREAQDE
jgi:hypothetical protein